MTSTFQAAESYRRTAVQSASPLQLVVMLYDGALRFLTEAKDGHAQRNLRIRATGVSKALAVITECQSTLNLEKGGVIARDLDRLYAYMVERLLDVSRRNDPSGIDEVHKLLTTLREGWTLAATPEMAAVAASR